MVVKSCGIWNNAAVTKLDRTFVLWDVDHTLIENSGVSKATYGRAFELLVGNPSSVRPETDGRTDFEILDNLFSANSLAVPDDYEKIFEDALTRAMAEKREDLRVLGYALPGAKEALEALSQNDRVIQSALTGNIASNAREKLAAFGLDVYLDLEVGGYGSDHVVRSKLADVARQKVLERYGIEFDRRSTVMIGDTVRDVQAALDGHAAIIGVATGADSVPELLVAGADEVIESLADTDEFLRLLRKVREG